MRQLKKFLIVLILAGQLCGQGIYFPVLNQLPAYLFLLIFLGVIMLFEFFAKNHGRIRIDRKYAFIPISLLLIMNIIAVSILNAKISVDRLSLIIFSFVFCMACCQAINRPDDVEFFEKAYIVIVFCSAVVAIGQSMSIPFASELWMMTHVGDKLTGATESSRYLGLASDALQFGYHVSAAFAITLFVNFKKRNGIKKIICLMVFAYALIVNNTRSAQVAVLAIILVWLFSRNKDEHKMLVSSMKVVVSIALFIASMALIFNFDAFLLNTRFGNMNDGASARIPMILTAFNHALHYPLGMGAYQVQPELIVATTSQNYIHVVTNTAHNCLGNCVAAYGFIGLILFLLLYKSIYTVYKESRVKLNSNITIGAFCAVCGLLLNAFFHNAYILSGEISSFLFFGIILASNKLSQNEEAHL